VIIFNNFYYLCVQWQKSKKSTAGINRYRL
jgi:hypothetical protein